MTALPAVLLKHVGGPPAPHAAQDETLLADQRRHLRQWCSEDIICETYNFLEDRFDTCPAMLANKSRGGVMFTSDQAYDQGTPIFIRLKSSSDQGRVNDAWRDGMHAQVVWCRRPPSRGEAPFFKVGAKYFDPL
jgi:hypothetical protein